MSTESKAPPYVISKPESFQLEPRTPNFDHEAAEAVKWEGLPPISPTSDNLSEGKATTVFYNVSLVALGVASGIVDMPTSTEFANASGYVMVVGGTVVCADAESVCKPLLETTLESSRHLFENVSFINLKGGAVSSGLLTFGSPIGMEEIQGEMSTSDGVVWDAVLQGAALPDVVGKSVVRAADGLAFATRHA